MSPLVIIVLRSDLKFAPIYDLTQQKKIPH
jgi:hypothetical protein